MKRSGFKKKPTKPLKKTVMKKTAKPKTEAWWKKKFWTVFSLYIRTRDNFTCFTCDRKGNGSGMHAGHMIPRAAGGLSLYFHEQNVHAQCYHCNINLGGNGAIYAVKHIEKYGQEAFDEIIRLKNQGFKKYTIVDYQNLIEEYELKIEQLNG